MHNKPTNILIALLILWVLHTTACPAYEAQVENAPADQDLSRISRQKPLPESLPQNLFLSWDFLNSEKLFGTMVRQNDQRALDMYLALLRHYKPNAQASLSLDYDTVARDIGLGDWPKEASRRQINKTLRKLQNRYSLLASHSKNTLAITVFLKDHADPTKPYSRPQTRFLQIPPTYWDYGWSNILSLPAKAMLLLNFATAPWARCHPTGRSQASPWPKGITSAAIPPGRPRAETGAFGRTLRKG